MIFAEDARSGQTVAMVWAQARSNDLRACSATGVWGQIVAFGS